VEFPLTYSDVSGAMRTIFFAVRDPGGAPAPLPVVVWSHGGGSGHTNSVTSMAEWSLVTAKAGYFTVSIAHTPRSAASQQALCDYLQITNCGLPTPQNPDGFKYLNWDRPHDVRKVLDALEGLNSAGPFQGRIDLSRIAMAGHSGGAGGTMMVAGAARVHSILPVVTDDPRPIAFLAFSPQGANSHGFFETDFRQPATSWDSLRRPFLTATGEGDGNCELEEDCSARDIPYSRRIPFRRMPGPDKYLLYIRDADTYHGLYGSLESNCLVKVGSLAKCRNFVSWLTSAALAFLDAHLRGSALARVWLSGDYMAQASAGVVEWKTK